MADAEQIPDPHLCHLFDGEPVMNVYKSEVTNLSAGTPGPDLLKSCIDMFREATKDRMAKEEENAYLFQYGITSGLWEFREELAKFLTDKYGEKVYRQSLILTCGATHGLQIILTTIIHPNAVIFVEEPTYMIALDAFKQFTAMKIVPVPMDSEGANIAALERIVIEEKANGSWEITKQKPFWAFFYAIPVFHNPTGTTLSKSRCEDLVKLARKLDFLVVCDDVYNLLHYGEGHPPRRLFSYDATLEGYENGHVISNCSFSKIMAPGVRVGWLEAPARLALLFRTSGYLKSGGGVNQYMAGLITSILEMGLQEKLLNMLVHCLKERMSALCDTLQRFLPKGCSFIRPDGGYFVWITVLPYSVDMNKFVPWCQEKYKISAIPGIRFSVSGECRNNLRLAIAFHKKEKLVEAAERMCEALGEFISLQEKM